MRSAIGYDPSMLRGARSGLFHAVVGLGLASCGGVTSTSKDASPNGMASDATSVDSGGNSASDATLMVRDSAAPDATSYDAVANNDAADDAVEALDASFDARPDVVWIPPVQ
jgi:hypothetical protein